MRTRVKAAGGAELEVVTGGQGPVCLVPSAMGAGPYQRQLPAALGERLTLAHVDLRGSGLSGGAASDLSLDVAVADFEAVRRHLGVDTLSVLGHSVLGMLAIEYARRHPAAVTHVIAVGTPPRGDMSELMKAGAAFFEADASPERKRLLAENLSRLPSPPAQDEVLFAQTPLRFHDPALDARPLFEGAVARPEIFSQLLGVVAPAWDVLDPLRPPLSTPLLVALGRHDYVVPWTLWDDVAPRLPSATLEVFAQSGHQPFVEEPHRFTEVVGLWMERTRR